VEIHRRQNEDNMSRIYEALTEKNSDEKRSSIELTTYGDGDSSDGFAYGAAAARERELRGRLLTYADWVWNTKEGEIPEGKRLALGMAAFWVEWKDGKPVKYIRPEPGRLLPGRESLGRHDESEWELGPDGEPRDPLQNTRLVYLVDEDSAEAFTFSTSSSGGRGAVDDLGDQIVRKRRQYPGAVPIIELGSAPMQTKYGRKSKPVLKIVAWRFPTDPKPRLVEAAVPSVPALSRRDSDDAIPF
jgi:hypothetical protein